MTPRKHSALVFILKGLMPYSRENLMLSYKPNQFFNELEKQSGYSRKALDEAIRRAKHKGLIIKTNGELRLTKLGQRQARPYVATRLKDAKLMVIFDVPNQESAKRRQLRLLLRQWNFKMVQRSVWITDFDHRKSVEEAVKELELGGCVRVYECSLISK